MELVANIRFEFIQLSESSASNPHIALKFCETYNTITSKDFIIFGWSHPNRQSWFNNGFHTILGLYELYYG